MDPMASYDAQTAFRHDYGMPPQPTQAVAPFAPLNARHALANSGLPVPSSISSQQQRHLERPAAAVTYQSSPKQVQRFGFQSGRYHGSGTDIYSSVPQLPSLRGD